MTIADLLHGICGEAFVSDAALALAAGKENGVHLMETAKRQALNDLLRKLGIDIELSLAEDKENRRHIVRCRFVQRPQALLANRSPTAESHCPPQS